jgi:hypothetical protein
MNAGPMVLMWVTWYNVIEKLFNPDRGLTWGLKVSRVGF